MKYINYLFAVGFVAYLASCSKENHQSEAVMLDINIGQVAIDTKSGISDLPSLSDRNIVLVAINKETGEIEYGDAGRQGVYKINTSGSAETETGEIQLLKQRAAIYAGFPAKEVTIKEKVPFFSLPSDLINMTPTFTDNSTRADFDLALPEKDYMYGVAYSNNGFATSQPYADNGKTENTEQLNEYGPKVSIGLRHALAQIVLKINRANYRGDGILNKVVYSRNLAAIGSSTTMSLQDGSLTNLTAAELLAYTYDLSPIKTNAIKLDDSEVIISNYALAQLEGESNIEIDVDGKKIKLQIPTDSSWEAGNIYTYKLSVSDTKLTLTSVTVEDWSSTELGNVIIN